MNTNRSTLKSLSEKAGGNGFTAEVVEPNGEVYKLSLDYKPRPGLRAVEDAIETALSDGLDPIRFLGGELTVEDLIGFQTKLRRDGGGETC